MPPLSDLSHSLADRWATADFTTSFLHSSRFLAFRSIFHSKPVHSLMLSSHLFLCLPLCLPPWTVPCRIVLASPDDRVTCPYHFTRSSTLAKTILQRTLQEGRRRGKQRPPTVSQNCRGGSVPCMAQLVCLFLSLSLSLSLFLWIAPPHYCRDECTINKRWRISSQGRIQRQLISHLISISHSSWSYL